MNTKRIARLLVARHGRTQALAKVIARLRTNAGKQLDEVTKLDRALVWGSVGYNVERM